MILADVLKYVFLVLGLVIVVVSCWLASVALFPDTVGRARIAYAERPLRITMIGVFAAVPLVLIGLSVAKAAPHPLLKIGGGVLIALPILLGLVGSAGLSERVGQGLVHADDSVTPWRRSLRGAIVLALTFLLPFIGWFGLLPWALLSGFGAALSSMGKRKAVGALSETSPS